MSSVFNLNNVVEYILLILVLYIFLRYGLKTNFKNKYAIFVIILGTVVVYTLLRKYVFNSVVESFYDLGYTQCSNKPCGSNEGALNDAFEQNNSASTNYNIDVKGGYDGQKLEENNKVVEESYPLHGNNEKLIVNMGTPYPLKHEEVASQIPNDSMFFLARNKVDRDCCPSTYSTSNGCVCITPDQKDMLNGRGGNRTAPSYY